MGKPSPVKTSPGKRDDAPLRRANIAAGTVIEHFKTKASAGGYQTLINEARKQAIQAEAFEGIVCRVAVMARP